MKNLTIAVAAFLMAALLLAGSAAASQTVQLTWRFNNINTPQAAESTPINSTTVELTAATGFVPCPGIATIRLEKLNTKQMNVSWAGTSSGSFVATYVAHVNDVQIFGQGWMAPCPGVDALRIALV